MRASWTPIVEAAKRRQPGSWIYDIARVLGSPFSYDVIGFENIQTAGPAIFTANHLGSLGPVEIILSIPINFYPWIIADMMNFKQAPEYLFNDFVQPVMHLDGRFGMLTSTLITKISVRLLRKIGGVSIDRLGGLTPDGFRQSLRLLHEGKNLLIFPEDLVLPLDPLTQMRGFMPGFATLCSLFQKQSDSSLPVYPMAVHAGSETITIGTPEFYSPRGSHRESIDEFTRLVEGRIRSMYLDAQKTNDEMLGG